MALHFLQLWFNSANADGMQGVILYGEPGTGKTLLAKAVANSTSATFLRVVGSELIQKYLGDGPKLVRELFRVAEELAPTIVFIGTLPAAILTIIWPGCTIRHVELHAPVYTSLLVLKMLLTCGKSSGVHDSPVTIMGGMCCTNVVSVYGRQSQKCVLYGHEMSCIVALNTTAGRSQSLFKLTLKCAVLLFFVDCHAFLCLVDAPPA